MVHGQVKRSEARDRHYLLFLREEDPWNDLIPFIARISSAPRNYIPCIRFPRRRPVGLQELQMRLLRKFTRSAAHINPFLRKGRGSVT